MTTITTTDLLWIESRTDYSTDDIAALSGLPQTLIDELVACGALPRAEAPHAAPTGRFAADAVVLARAASRLREHFELDERGVAVAVTLLRRVRVLETRVVELQAQRPRQQD